MPVLDAKALETDPDGMAFLRAVITPGLEREEVALRPLLRQDPPSITAAAHGRADEFPVPSRSESTEAVPAA